MKVYTRSGDRGTTSLVGGTRVSKCHPRIEAYGSLDELNSWIGLVTSLPAELPADALEQLQRVQNRLFDIGTILATEPTSTWQPDPLPDAAVAQLEQAIDRLDATVPAHNQFILPGGCQTAARAQVARTVARRCERLLLQLGSAGIEGFEPAPAIMQYINRLSDYLFVVGRAANHFTGTREIFWQKNCY